MSPLEVTQPTSTSGRTRLQYQEQGSSWEPSGSGGIPRSTGIWSVNPLLPMTSNRSPRIYLFVIMVISQELGETIYDQLRWTEPVQYSGVQLGQARAIVLGVEQGWTVTLRIPLPNGGVVTEVKELLLSMSLEESSTYPTYSGGWTSIQSVWKPREALYPSPRVSFGSQATYTQEIGGATSTVLR